MQPGLGWSGEKVMIRLIMEEVEAEEGCLGLAKEMAAGTRMGFLLWHILLLRAEVSAFPIDHLHTEPLRQLPGQHRRPHS